ncbi:response regulator, partial [Candidatus Poribacteria bacterium]|nr:response regulator [Candidatus Poribacteria bacterium]
MKDTYNGVILIMDDSEKNQSALENILKPLNYNIIKSYNGNDGLSKIKETNPDLIILDLMMPELDGFEVLKILKSHEATRLIPVIVLSTFNELEYNKNVIDLGAEDFITKPYNPILISMRIKSLMRTKSLIDKLDNSEGVLFALANAIEARDEFTEGHINRVTELVVKLAGIMNFPDEEIEILRKGAVLHDIGKIGIRDEILKKTGKLTPDEFNIMKQHTIIGEKICSPLKSLSNLR